MCLRSDHFVEKTLKAPGGLAYGRCLTPSTQAKFVHVIRQCAPICNALEDFCGVQSRTSEQHNDLRASTSARDSDHFTTLYNWLDLYSPFSYASVDGLVYLLELWLRV